MTVPPVEMTVIERRVLILRYGLDDGVPRTLNEVGQSLGHSSEWARQVESKAFRRLLIFTRAEAAGAKLSRPQRVDIVTFSAAWLEWEKSHGPPGGD